MYYGEFQALKSLQLESSYFDIHLDTRMNNVVERVLR